MEQFENIAEIFFKIHAKLPLSEPEEMLLSNWRNETADHEEAYQKLLDEKVALEDLREFITLDTSNSWNKIVAITRNQTGAIRELRPQRQWRKYLIAAVAIGVICIGAWFWTKKYFTHKSSSVPQVAVKDVPPGGNKAVLTLANGASIVLDSMNNGMIAHQGNVLVSKTDSGRLSYKAIDLAHNENLFNTLSTPKAGQFQLVLPDGTRVWLNNASSLRYPVLFSGNIREVELQGEVYFEVAKDPARPFKVKVNKMTVEVLGTSFNISAYVDETTIKTTLLSGSVRVSVSHLDKSVNLHPGEQAQLINSREIQTQKNIDVDAVVSWKDGLFTFDKSDTRTVMNQLARWYDLEVIYQGEPAQRQFGGEIERGLNLSDVLKILGRNGFHLKVEGRTVTVLP